MGDLIRWESHEVSGNEREFEDSVARKLELAEIELDAIWEMADEPGPLGDTARHAKGLALEQMLGELPTFVDVMRALADDESADPKDRAEARE